MSSQYSYDESGLLAGYFALTFLFLVLVPLTISLLRPSRTSSVPAYPYPRGSPRPRPARAALPSKKALLVLLGWAAFAALAYRVKNTKVDRKLYDPFEILGIAASATEREIKKHYRKLSLKFHPDKVKLAVNQTREMADDYFVSLTKAYKALTDEQTRLNYELYGHPDGKQDFSMGVAIPKWVVESKNNIWVLGVYGLLFGAGLPYVVGKWWYSTRSLTKDRVLNSTASTFFRNLAENATFFELIELLGAADEFAKTAGARKGALPEVEKDVKAKLNEEYGHQWVPKGQLDKPHSRRATTLLYAHILRLPLSSDLKSELSHLLPLALHTSRSLLSIALAHNWLPTSLLVSSLQAHLLQATLPKDAAVYAVHGVPKETARRAGSAKRIAKMDEEERRAALRVGQSGGVNEEDYAGVRDVVQRMAAVEVVDASFSVIGEKVVTPGAIVQFKTKLRLVPNRFTEPTPAAAEKAAPAITEKVDSATNGDVPEKPASSSTPAEKEERSTYAYTPYYPEDRASTYLVLLGDAKMQKIIVQPTWTTDLPLQRHALDTRAREVTIQFQAPPQPGLYTFRAIAKSETDGSEAFKEIKLRVEPPSAAGAEDEEDEISDPEEDTLAGQMAQLRGGSVKPAKRGDDSDDSDDDTSGTDDDQQGGDDSSDSDSD